MIHSYCTDELRISIDSNAKKSTVHDGYVPRYVYKKTGLKKRNKNPKNLIMPPKNVECNASLYKQKKRKCEKSKSRERIVGSWLTWESTKQTKDIKGESKGNQQKKEKGKGKGRKETND